MSAAVETARRVWTEAELEALPEDGFIHEVVNGELMMSPKNNYTHGDICAQLLIALGTHAKAHKLGAVWDSSTGFWMRNRNCRAPDISFVSKARLKGFRRSARQFFPGAPDLAVEILSPNNTRAGMDERLADFFASGTRAPWIINPETESVGICSSLTQRNMLGSGGVLERESLLPRF